MSVIIQTRGEVGGGVAAHLQCSHCGHFSKSHAEQFSHLAAYHPTCLDSVAMGRLGNILMYQSSARLYHCSNCFYTSRDFAKLYKHIITKHCMDKREERGEERGSEGGEERGNEGGEERGNEREEKGSERGEERGSEGREEGNVKVEGEEEEVKDDPNRKRSSEGEEEEEQSEGLETVKPEEEGEKNVPMIDGGSFRCLICGWRSKQKAVSVSHVVRKHEIPKSYGIQAIRWETAALSKTQGGVAEEEEGAGLSEEMLKEEIEATAKVISFISSRYVCLICGWKTKLKGFATSHVVRSHNVECPYRCKECSQKFFLPSQLQHHVRSTHRPGRYACPFCCFRSEFLGGFRRHCSRCSVREEEGREGAGGGGGREEDNEEEETGEKREMRETRKRRSTEMMMLDEVKEEEDV